MDMRYNVGQSPTVFNRESRQYAHDDHHKHDDPSTGQTENRPTDRSCQNECHHGHSSMVFHVGNKETILFGFWTTNSTLALVLSCLIVFIIAMSYEALKCYREWLKKCDKKRQEGGSDKSPVSRSPRKNLPGHQSQHTVSTISTETVPLTVTVPAPGSRISGSEARTETKVSVRFPHFNPIHWYQTLLHMLQVTISFLLMLIFMTFNVWLCLAVVLGAGVGYFIFFARSENVSDHCN